MNERIKELKARLAGLEGSYYDFCDYADWYKEKGKMKLVEELKKRGYNVEEKEVAKVNETKRGLYVSKGDAGIMLYGECMDEDVEEIIDMIEKKFNNKINDVASAVNDRDYVLSHVRCRLINKERNAEYLANKPHIDFLDLAAVFDLDTSEFTGGSSSAVLPNKVVQKIGLTTEELFFRAMENEEISYDSLMNMATGNHLETPREADALVVTKANKPYGATAMLHKEILAEISAMWEDDLVICPSSVHEIIVLRDSDVKDNSAIIDIVTSINATKVSATEFLSNNVYYYDHATNKVEFM